MNKIICLYTTLTHIEAYNHSAGQQRKQDRAERRGRSAGDSEREAALGNVKFGEEFSL